MVNTLLKFFGQESLMVNGSDHGIGDYLKMLIEFHNECSFTARTSDGQSC